MDALEEWRSNGDAEGRDGLAGHPDLSALGRRLRIEMDETLRAEQHAARVAAQRRSTLRDRFLLAEDRAERLHVAVVDGSDIAGQVVAVGADHIVIAHAGRRCWIAMHHVVAVRSTG
jgi:hypothetical protein